MSKMKISNKMIPLVASAAIATLFLNSSNSVKADKVDDQKIDREKSQNDLVKNLIDDQKKEIANVETQIELNQKEIESLKDKLQEKNEQFSVSKEKLAQIEQEKDSIDKQLDVLNSENRKNQSELSELGRDLSKTKDELIDSETVQINLEERVNENEDQLNLIKETLQDRKEILQNLKDTLDAMTINDKLVVANDEKSRIALQNYGRDMSYLEQRIQLVNKYTEEIGQLEEKIENLSSLLNIEQSEKEKEALTKQIKQFESELNRKIKGKASYENSVKEYQNAAVKDIADLEKAASKVPNIKAHFDQKKKLQAQIDSGVEKEEKLEKQLAAVQIKKDELQNKLNSLKEDQSVNQVKVMELNSKIDKIQKRLNEIDKESVELVQKKTNCFDQLKELNDDQNNTAVSLARISEKITSLNDKGAMLTEKLTQEKKKLAQYEVLAELLEKPDTQDNSTQTENDKKDTVDQGSQTDNPSTSDNGAQTESQTPVTKDESTQTETKETSNQKDYSNNSSNPIIFENSQRETNTSVKTDSVSTNQNTETTQFSAELNNESTQTAKKTTILVQIKKGKLIAKINGVWTKISFKQLKDLTKRSNLKFSGKVSLKNKIVKLYLKSGKLSRQKIRQRKVRIFELKQIDGIWMARISEKQVWISTSDLKLI